MPTASDELRARMGELFGDEIDEQGPYKFLRSKGWTEKGGLLIAPPGERRPSDEEFECVSFLCDEWDFAFEGWPTPTSIPGDRL